MTEFAHMLKNNNQKRKTTATIENKCFNYYKLR